MRVKWAVGTEGREVVGPQRVGGRGGGAVGSGWEGWWGRGDWGWVGGYHTNQDSVSDAGGEGDIDN